MDEDAYAPSRGLKLSDNVFYNYLLEDAYAPARGLQNSVNYGTWATRKTHTLRQGD